MRIALIGYGKMGKRIGQLAVQHGHVIVHTIDTVNRSELSKIKDADVAIEFTTPATALVNCRDIVELGVPCVCGTTGWYEHLHEVVDLTKLRSGVFFHASNFSIGVQVAMAASNYMAGILSRFAEYTGYIEEWHHTAKKDAPSGTAITFAEGILEAHPSYQTWKLTETAPESLGRIKEGVLPVFAYRENEIPGTHRIVWSSEIDEIYLEHKAFNRDGFALGAIAAAEFASKASPGVYTMNDLLKLNP